MTSINGISNTENNNIPILKNHENTNKKETSIWRKAGAYVAGGLTGELISVGGVPIVNRALARTLAKPSQIESEIIASTVPKVMAKTGLASKPISIVLESSSTAFDVEGKSILMLQGSKIGQDFGIFHELGHAHTSYFGKFLKRLQSLRTMPSPKTKSSIAMSIVLGILTATALLTDKKDNPETKLDKTTSFIKNNIGKITFATFLPTLIEEASASIKAAKFTKGILPKNIISKINKQNAICYASYLLGALIASGGMALAVKIRDKIVE